jgi:hypothetical protein
MKVFFKQVTTCPFSELSIYSSLNPIPFSLRLNEELSLPETIYSRNISGENFIEFRFNKNTKQLYEISLVAIHNETVQELDEKDSSQDQITDNMEYFNCFIDENIELDFSIPMSIIRSRASITIIWSDSDLVFTAISDNCVLGTNGSGLLCSVTLVKLSETSIQDVFGF